MLQVAKKAGQITKNPPYKQQHVPDGDMSTFTLEEAGISRKLSSRDLASCEESRTDHARA
jgi:hypothetical protein